MNNFPAITADNNHTALIAGDVQVSYSELRARIESMASGLLAGKADLNQERVAFFMPASPDYVVTIHGIWRAGGIAVPLNIASAPAELEHVLTTAGVDRILVHEEKREILVALADRLGITLSSPEKLLADKPAQLPSLDPDRRAMMLFTSGTTNKPKGVVTTHRNIVAQITTLIDAWHWTDADVIPLFLPMHHVHGIINVLGCGLWAGATVHLFEKFDMQVIAGGVALHRFNLFMAVPTVYVKLIQHLESIDETQAKDICEGFGAMRLNISGSAACPVKLFNHWQALTGQVLLERYGMTEIGMAISNPYEGERRAGHVGQPLPGVTVGLFDENDQMVTEENTPGEIRIKGENVFLEYWNNEKATVESFRDDWFCSGDVAVIEDGYYRIMGRSSIDIIKSGGYKLSALEIEGTLLTHDAVAEVAVIGVEDDTWGEAVSAFVVLNPGKCLDLMTLKSWCQDRMSSYKIPKHLHVLESLPRNAMGKVTKPELRKIA